MAFGGGSKSSFQTKSLPGIFEAQGSAKRIGASLEDILSGIQTGGQTQAQLQQETLRPEFGAQSASEQALLEQIMSLTGGKSAARGLGPATQGALAQDLAPALIGLRESRLGGLRGAAGIEQAGQAQAIQGLLELAGLAAPQVVGGQVSKTKGGVNLGGLAGLAGSLIAGPAGGAAGQAIGGRVR
jgi:hypothetical protein